MCDMLISGRCNCNTGETIADISVRHLRQVYLYSDQLSY